MLHCKRHVPPAGRALCCMAEDAILSHGAASKPQVRISSHSQASAFYMAKTTCCPFKDTAQPATGQSPLMKLMCVEVLCP